MSDEAPRLESLLRRRGAWFEDGGLSVAEAKRRAAVTCTIAAAFPDFERLRDRLIGRSRSHYLGIKERDLALYLASAGVLRGSLGYAAGDVEGLEPASPEAHRYLRGGWLEEYAGLALLAAGADEVRIGQIVRWVVRGFNGVNEIDAIARFSGRIVFVSAKALRSRLVSDDFRHREHLMDALQEADNLADHFGDSSSAVVLLVTTDLYDEQARKPRYQQLHGKAAALGVELCTLDTLGWDAIVDRFARLGGQSAGPR